MNEPTEYTELIYIISSLKDRKAKMIKLGIVEVLQNNDTYDMNQ